MKHRLVSLAAVCALVLAGTNVSLAMGSKSATKSDDMAGDMAKAEPMALNLDVPSRPDKDKERDAARKPVEVLSFLGIGEGDTVMDLMASGGWYTEVLSIAVGPDGKVYAQNPAAFLAWNDGYYNKALGDRLKDGRLANVIRLDAEFDATGLAPGSLDAAMSALNFHDLYNPNPASTDVMLASVFALLKPGGVLGIIDHVGDAGADNEKLHRIEPSKVVEAAEKAGFVVDATSDILMTGVDDHAKSPFDEATRGKTDRFLLRLKKPA